MASHHSYTIPIEGYETELQNLGQHVDIPETPVKVVKITKTIAVKIPVPYPVKVREKVPYPVHIAKPYPVPVPQIIKVPHIVSPKSGHAYGNTASGHDSPQNPFQDKGQPGNAYNVEEASSDDDGSFGVNSYNGGNSGYNHNLGSYGDEYSAEYSPRSSFGDSLNAYYGHSNNNDFETKNFDQPLNQYSNNQIPSTHFGGSSNENYH